jgi:hypothetical protein
MNVLRENWRENGGHLLNDWFYENREVTELGGNQ